MMDGRGGCCIARYAAGGSDRTYDDARKVERVMLKFRPIAPKPVSTGSGSVFGSSSSDNSNNKSSSGETTTYVKAGRCKRKNNTPTAKRRYNGGRKRVRCSTSHSLDEKRDECSGVTTLSLLPESPLTAGINTPTSRSAPTWLSFTNNNNSPVSITTNNSNYFSNGRARVGRVVGSEVTLERVTDTWVSGQGLGHTDEERMMNLEHDTCPGFITEGYDNRVRWLNKAYKKMVFGGDEEAMEGDEVVVWVVMKEKLLMDNCKAFTCRVKVKSSCKKEIRALSCDVWRMDDGCGFAWRLDVKTELSLGW